MKTIMSKLIYEKKEQLTVKNYKGNIIKVKGPGLRIVYTNEICKWGIGWFTDSFARKQQMDFNYEEIKQSKILLW